MEINGETIRQHRQKIGLSQSKLSELSGVPQHVLSAFELQKIEISSATISAILSALQNTTKVSNLITRKKRYREHEYHQIEKLPERIAKSAQTVGNGEYRQLLEKIHNLHKSSKKEGLTALSLFSGCGGFSLGFSAAGFRVKGFLELNEGIRQIYKANFPDSIEIGGDITQISQESLDAFYRNIGSVDVIIGGPPCQGFSLAGKREVNDPRNSLFKHYLRFVDVFRPKIAVLENVRLLSSMKSPSGKLVKDEIFEAFANHGYKIKYFEINAKDYGVPQHRERILFCAIRNDLDISPSMPNKTHGEETDLFSETRQYRTFADACSDLPFIESGETTAEPLHHAVKHPNHVIEWLWNTPEGYSAHDNEDERLRPPSGYNTTYKRQVWNEPAATVQTTFGMISGSRNVHPIATRSLTIREAARIQSFPDGYAFPGNLGDVRTGIGNAVPPLLAYTVAMHIKEKLKSCKNIRLPN